MRRAYGVHGVYVSPIRETAAVAALLRLLARLAPLGNEHATLIGADECMRALDRLCDALPSGDAQNRAARQMWEVSPVPPEPTVLRRWATEWDKFDSAAKAA